MMEKTSGSSDHVRHRLPTREMLRRRETALNDPRNHAHPWATGEVIIVEGLVAPSGCGRGGLETSSGWLHVPVQGGNYCNGKVIRVTMEVLRETPRKCVVCNQDLPLETT